VVQVILAAALILFSATASATAGKPPLWTTRDYLQVNWSPAMPVGNTADIAGRPAFIGAAVGYRFRVNDRLSVGPRIQWQMFEDRRAATLMRDGISTSGIRRDELRVLAPSAVAHLYFQGRQTLLPFLGAGAGAGRFRQTTRLSGTDRIHSDWHPTVLIEAGMIAMLHRIPILLCIALQHGIITRAAPGQTFVGFQLGVLLIN